MLKILVWKKNYNKFAWHNITAEKYFKKSDWTDIFLPHMHRSFSWNKKKWNNFYWNYKNYYNKNKNYNKFYYKNNFWKKNNYNKFYEKKNNYNKFYEKKNNFYKFYEKNKWQNYNQKKAYEKLMNQFNQLKQNGLRKRYERNERDKLPFFNDSSI